MNSINHNSELSNFSNYIKKDLANSLNFNDYPCDNPNSPSLNFAYFNQYSQTSNPLDKQEAEIKLEENLEPKDQTIGFNSFHGFLESSMPYPFEEFKNMKFKKPSTFQFNQGYLNTLYDPNDIFPEEVSKNVEERKSQMSKGKQKQKIRKSGYIEDRNEEKQSLAQLENLLLDQYKSTIKQSKKATAIQEGQLYSQNCLQNLKSIAKIAYEEIKKDKMTSYQAIAQSLLLQLSRQFTLHEESHSNKHERSSVSSEDKSSRKSELIETMIKNKSFSQIKQMTQIEEDSFDTKTRRRFPKFEHEENESQNDLEVKEPGRNIKNIRRRLYDAINVMLAANVIQKQQRGCLSVKSLDSYRKIKGSLRSREENASVDEMERKIEQKKKVIEGKKKYRQFLGIRYLLLEKHVAKNKALSQKQKQKAQKKQHKLPFPLVFFNLQWPMKLSIQSNSKCVEIESLSEIDVNCEMDLLGLLYWIEKEEIAKKEEELETRVERAKGDVSDEEGLDKRKGNKKVKIGA